MLFRSVGTGISLAFLLENSYEFSKGEFDIWNLAMGVANNNAQNQLFKQNEDLFIHLRDNAPHSFTRSSARFILDSMYQGYAEVFSEMITHAVTAGGEVVIGVFLLFASGPAALVVGIGLAVFNIFDAVIGWSDTNKTRGRVMCLSDMTESTNALVNKYYLNDDYTKSPSINTYHILGRHLENLVNLRITGESRFIQLYDYNTPDCSTAAQNVTNVIIIADDMGLFIVY